MIKADWEQQLEEYRRQHFKVEVTESRTEHGEMQLSVTHNGTQWSSISLTKDEAHEVVKVLRRFLKTPRKK